MGKSNSTKHINEVMGNSVADAVKPPALEEAERLLEIKRNQIFIEDDSFIGNPYSLLGRVLEIRSKTGGCTQDVNDGYAEFSVFPIPGITVDENSKIKQPQKTKSFLVDSKLSLEVGFLSFLNAELDTESLFSVIVYNQAVGLLEIHKPDYLNGLRTWIRENQNLIDDPHICHLLVVTGMVQKHIIRKKYKKFDIKTKGGAYGLNVNGNLYTSTEDYSLDTRFGLSYQRIPIPNKINLPDFKLNDIASRLQDLTELNAFKSMDTLSNKGLISPINVAQNELVEKMLLPSNEEMEFIGKVKYKK